MKRLLTAISIVTAGWISTSANVVDCLPGALNSLIESPDEVVELTIRGTVNASDLKFIADSMPGIRSLDLSSCKIVEGVISHLEASKIESIVLPCEGRLSIGDFAFASSALKNVEIPSNVESIGTAAFADCRALTSVSIAGASVGESSFENCESLATVSGANTIVQIGNSAFEGCISLSDFEFSSELQSIGNSAFAGCRFESVVIPSEAPLDSIGEWAFAYNPKLMQVSLPQSTASVGKGSFFACSALCELTLPAACTRIDDYGMTGVAALGYLALPGELEYIGSHAMEGMTGLGTVDGTQLTAVPGLGEEVFFGVNQALVHLNVDKRYAEAFQAAEQWQEFNINSDVTNSDFSEILSNHLYGRLIGDVIYVESIGLPIDYLELYTIEGRMPVRAKLSAEQISVDVSAFDSRIFIVRCVMADKSIATLKLAR